MSDGLIDRLAGTQPVRRAAGVEIAVLAALASMGTLATNILLPSLPAIATSLQVTTPQVTASITVFLAVFAIGQLFVGPISDRYGRRLPVLVGFAIFILGSIWCALATDLPNLLAGRAVQALGACASSVLSRAIARDLFSGPALARVLTLIMIAMATAPGFSPLLGSALDHLFGWRGEFVFVAIFALAAALAYGLLLGETHHSPRSSLDPRSVMATYGKLMMDRRFIVPAASVSLILGGLFTLFSITPRILLEDLAFAPMQLGFFFAGTVLVVFTGGFLATRLAPKLGLERAVSLCLLLTVAGGIGIAVVGQQAGGFLPFLIAASVFLIGMGVVNPLTSAQTLSPFGDNAGAASALLGFWQMFAAAAGVFIASVLPVNATTSLGIVIACGAIAATLIYRLRNK